MTLAQHYVSILNEGWTDVFADRRTHRRAVEHALAWPSAMGDRTISQGICMLGRSEQDWSADYKLYSRSVWNAEQLFDRVIDEYLKRYPQGPVVMPMDDTKVHKTGKHIPGACWQRDPMSPPLDLFQNSDFQSGPVGPLPQRCPALFPRRFRLAALKSATPRDVTSLDRQRLSST